MTRTRRLAALALVAGVLAGAIVAIAVPRSGATHPPDAPLPLPLPGPVRIAPASPPQPATLRVRVHPGTLRTDMTVKDPSGGADWQIRSYIADRLVPRSERRPGTSGLVGRSLCAQLGRIVNGRFGWIDATNTFRPQGFGYGTRSGPMLCGSRIPDIRRLPELDLRTLITAPDRPDPQVRGSVLWGLVGTHVDGVVARLGARMTRPHRSPRGAFLLFAGPALHQSQARVEIAYPHGQPKVVRFGHPERTGLPPTSAPRPVPGSARLEARAPDPGGGPSWGLVAARGSRGGWCFGHAEQIVGDRAGQIDGRIGSLYEDDGTGFDMSCEDSRFPLTRKRPVNYGRSGGTGLTEGQTDPGRALLRTLPGRMTIYGVTRPDVKLVTISTPRDVRTIVPSPRAHAFVTVYDGDFASGQIAITATFTDGTSVTHTEQAGM